MSQKTAVFLCDCGTALQGGVDFEQVRAGTAGLDGVVAVEVVRALCMKPGELDMARVIQESGADRIVAAACSPRTHGHLIEAAAAASGINRFLVEQLDVKGVIAGTSGADRLVATRRALGQIAMAVARAGQLEALEPIPGRPERTLVVIGGGVAGVSAAYVAAAAGVRTFVVEASPRLGGRAARLKVEFPAAGLTAEEMAGRLKAVESSPHVSVLTSSTVAGISGRAGKYAVAVKGPAGTREIAAGAVVLATGAGQAEPAGLYGLGRPDGMGKKVTTQSALEEKLHAGLPGVRNLVFIQCAGGRDAGGGGSPYCSRTCCTVAMKQAVYAKKTWPFLNVHFLFRDLQIGGTPLVKVLYHAPGWGIDFARFDPSRPPAVGEEVVEVHDLLTGAAKTIQYDLAVLATPTVPSAQSAALGEMLGFSVDRFGFVAEPLMRARPKDHPERGVFVAGAAHWPCTLLEASQQGVEAASRALKMMDDPVANEPCVAIVDPDKCIACKLCEGTCGFGSIRVVKRKDGLKAEVDPMLCKGCGTCVGGCPVHAIAQKHYTGAQIEAQMLMANGKWQMANGK